MSDGPWSFDDERTLQFVALSALVTDAAEHLKGVFAALFHWNQMARFA